MDNPPNDNEGGVQHVLYPGDGTVILTDEPPEVALHMPPAYLAPDGPVPTQEIETETTHNVKVTSNETERRKGRRVTLTKHVETDDSFTGVFDVVHERAIKKLMDAHEAKRQAIEDTRANHRNFNRMLTLIGALLIGIAVVYTLPKLGHLGQVLGPYAFVITVALDTFLAAYSFIKHY